MRDRRLLRYSLVSLMLVGSGLGAFLLACSDDEETLAPPKADGGGAADAPAADTSAPGDGSVTDAATSSPARLQMVNAATDFGPDDKSGALRVCFAAGTTAANVQVTGLPALPDQSADPALPPGLPIGVGGVLTGTGLDLTPLFVQPYLMNAERLFARGIVKPGAGDPGKTCTEILGATFDGGVLSGNGPLVENVDYWKLPVIPAGTFQKDKSYILVLMGCANNASVTPTSKCGAGFAGDGGPGVGNLEVKIFEIDRATPVAADKLGAQFIHASPAGALLIATDAGAVEATPAFMKERADAGSATAISAGPVALGERTNLVQVGNVTTSDFFAYNPKVANILRFAGTAIRLSTIQSLSFPTGVPDGGDYRNGASFTFVAVGDPSEPADAGTGRSNTKAFHYLGLPNDPPVSVYKP